ncbi:MAG: hypothetical protein K6G43_03735 [Lachnospiraceae bacterium]|nr:hypothetical protein [Lachnospiraceae bacterium]
MTNTAKLNEIIRVSGLDRAFIAQMLGISSSSFENRVNGHREFKSADISIMRDLLNLSNDQLMEIFFS